MAVTEFKEVGGDEVSLQPRFEGEAVRTFLARVNQVRTATKDILLYRDTPKLGDSHPLFPALFCENVRVFRTPDSNFWLEAFANYRTLAPDDPHKNPRQRPAQIEWSTQRIKVPTFVDHEGKAMLNTAGELMKAVERDDALFVVNVEKNVGQVPVWLLNYENAINSDAVRIRGITFPKHTLKLDGLNVPEREFEFDVPFYRLTFRLTYNKRTWLVKRLNMGRHELTTRTVRRDCNNPHAGYVPKTGLFPIRFKAPDGCSPGEQPLDEWFLDRQGKALPDIRQSSQTGPVVDPRQIVTLEFQLDEALPFSRLRPLLQ